MPALLAPDIIKLLSQDFNDGERIPATHSGKGVGNNLSPQLSWTGTPEGTAQLLLIIEDTDVPLPRPILHTIALLDPTHSELPTGGLNPRTAGLVFLPASFWRRGYEGPRPLPGHGPHRYGFYLFALPAVIVNAIEIKNVRQLIEVISGQIIARGRLIGIQER
jgi:phosphatidylethanolamine-binding protein (PEBP) family uncharacterized protein